MTGGLGPGSAAGSEPGPGLRATSIGPAESCLPGGGNGGDNRRERIRCGGLYLGALSLSNLVDSEDASSRRFAIAGAVLVGGLLFGFVLSGLFRWSPYYWQWLAYHNGLVAAVITYLLVSASDDGPRGSIRRPTAHLRIGAAETADVESIL